MAEGRKYGLLKYGRFSYDLWPTTWLPVPPYDLIDIWTPVPDSPPFVEAWVPTSVALTEFWTPVPDSPPFVEAWTSTSAVPTEVWVPATAPPRFS
jgi:hypothetical protein